MYEEYEVKFVDVRPVTRRMVHTHEVTFTCKQCGRTVTQQHYSGRVSYCSPDCRKQASRELSRKRTERHRMRKQQRTKEAKD